MSGYRFCRTDDVPLLVTAYNACYRPHFAEAPEFTVEAFKLGVRQLNLWASSSMLAFSGEEPVAVLLGAKRTAANLVHAIAVRPGHEGRGHGRHLVESLLRKVAILGPPRLAVEVPIEAAGARRFFERCGFIPKARYADFVAADDFAATAGARAPFEELATAVRFEDLVSSGFFAESAERSWQRSAATLRNLRDELSAFAVASDERVEAFVVARRTPSGGTLEIVALGAPRGEEVASLLRMLLLGLAASSGRRLSISRVSEEEVPFSWLSTWGFRKEREHDGLLATAA